jgi:hypothetical protein
MEQFSASPETRRYLAKAPAMWGKVLVQVMEAVNEAARGRRVVFEARTFADNLAGRPVERLRLVAKVVASPLEVADISQEVFQRKLDYGKLHEVTKNRILVAIDPW